MTPEPTLNPNAARYLTLVYVLEKGLSPAAIIAILGYLVAERILVTYWLPPESASVWAGCVAALGFLVVIGVFVRRAPAAILKLKAQRLAREA